MLLNLWFSWTEVIFLYLAIKMYKQIECLISSFNLFITRFSYTDIVEKILFFTQKNILWHINCRNIYFFYRSSLKGHMIVRNVGLIKTFMKHNGMKKSIFYSKKSAEVIVHAIWHLYLRPQLDQPGISSIFF